MTGPDPVEPVQPRPAPRRLALPIHRVWLTYALLGAIGLVFLGQLALAPFEGDADPIIEWGAKVNSLIVDGELWRLVTPIFIHASIVHFLFNAYALFVFGRTIESAYGALRFFLLFFFAGIGGTILSLWLNRSASVGASGAIFGLFAAEIVLLWRNRALLGEQANAGLRSLLVTAALNLVIAIVPGSRIDLWGHVGGALTGAVLAWWIGPFWRVTDSQSVLGSREIQDAQPFTLLRLTGTVVLYGGLLATALAYIALAWYLGRSSL